MQVINFLMALVGYCITLLFIATAISETWRCFMARQFHRFRNYYHGRKAGV